MMSSTLTRLQSPLDSPPLPLNKQPFDAGPDLSCDWRDLAMCKGQLNLFFARKAERPQARARREAKANELCSSCPVQPQCLDFARVNREYGFWAGESEEERHLAGYTLTAPIGIRARLAKKPPPIAS
jgi:WhiB family transcriptional regulator, redox-sensing transcriptional regulator